MRTLIIIVWFLIGAWIGWLVVCLRELWSAEYWRGHADGYAKGVSVMREHQAKVNGTHNLVTVYEPSDRWNSAIEEE